MYGLKIFYLKRGNVCLRAPKHSAVARKNGGGKYLIMLYMYLKRKFWGKSSGEIDKNLDWWFFFLITCDCWLLTRFRHYSSKSQVKRKNIKRLLTISSSENHPNFITFQQKAQFRNPKLKNSSYAFSPQLFHCLNIQVSTPSKNDTQDTNSKNTFLHFYTSQSFLWTVV